VQRAWAEHGVAIADFSNKQAENGQEETQNGEWGETAEFVVHKFVAQNAILRYLSRVA
jgi:hypothetical protein